MKGLALFLWLLVCVGLWGLFCNHFLWSDDIDKGKDIQISMGIDNSLVVKGKDIKFEAGSCQPFALYSDTEAVASIPSKEPLGGDCTEYYHAVKESFSPGKWILASGQPEVNLTSPNEIDAVVSSSGEGKFILSFLCFLLAALAFVLGCAFADEFLDIPEGWPNWVADRPSRYSSSSSSNNRR